MRNQIVDRIVEKPVVIVQTVEKPVEVIQVIEKVVPSEIIKTEIREVPVL